MFQQAISELPCVSVSKQVLVQNLLKENEFDLHCANEPLGGTHFCMNRFARKLVFTEVEANSEMAYSVSVPNDK